MNTPHSKTRRHRPNGFTLMELLIVISIMLILMLLAIPNFNRMRISVNEKSAINSLQVIYKDQTSYNGDYPANGYACTLDQLAGDAKSGAPTANGAQLLSGALQTGVKDGYQFAITNCTKVTVGNNDQITSYEVTAVPLAVGKTGNRGYCMDTLGQIKYDPQGGTNCTQSLQ